MPERIVAVALVTDAELAMFCRGLDRAYPVDQTPCFRELLCAIDDADREFRRVELGAPPPKAR